MKITRSTRQRAAAATAALVLVLTGCGSRLTDSQIGADNAKAYGISANQSGAGSSNAAGANGGPSASAKAGGSNPGSSTQTNGSQGAGAASAGSGTQAASSGPGGSTSPTGSCTGPATGSTVNIGQIGTNTGLVGTILAGAQKGTEIWATYINQHGGLNCHRVNLITADDGGDPSTGLSETEKMVQQDHVIAFVGSDNVLSEPTIAPYLESVKVPWIGGDDGVPQWYTNPDFFPEGSSGDLGIAGAVKTAIDQGHTKIGIVYCVEFALICSVVNSYLQKVIPALGGTLVYDPSVSIAQPDYTSQCLGARSAGANVVVLGLDPNSDVRFTGDCVNQNYNPAYVTTSLGLAPALLTSSSTIGLITAGGVFPFVATGPATAQFDQAVEQATGAAPNTYFMASTWVGGLILQTASSDLPASNPTAADVLAGLYKIKNNTFGGLTSPITYTPGQPTPTPTCYYDIIVAKGGFSAPNGLKFYVPTVQLREPMTARPNAFRCGART